MSCYEKLCLSSASPAVNEEEIRGSKCRDSRPRGHKHRQEDLRQPRSMLSREFARECVGECFRECVRECAKEFVGACVRECFSECVTWEFVMMKTEEDRRSVFGGEVEGKLEKMETGERRIEGVCHGGVWKRSWRRRKERSRGAEERGSGE